MSNVKFSQLPNLGNITANTIVPVVAASTNYTVTAANLQSYINSSTGNIVGGNLLTAGVVSATGNITGNYILGNGSQLTGLPATYGNANVVANLAALGSNPVSTTGNITGNYILGNGSQLTGLPVTYGNANVVANLAALGSNPVSTTGNVSAGYFIGNGSQLTGIATSSYSNSNVTTLLASLGSNIISGTGNITTTANISGNYILGNGSQLTGITAVSSYGNSNVATFLANFGSNTVSTTGNITSGNLSLTGNLTVNGSPVYGVAASYAKYTRTTAQSGSLVANTVIVCNVSENTFGSDISVNTSTGQVTLQAGRTYRLRGTVPSYASSSSASRGVFRWYDETAASYVGEYVASTTPGDGMSASSSSGGTAEYVFTPNATTVVSFRIVSGSITSLGGTVDYPASGGYPWIDIQVIGGQAPITSFSTAGNVVGGNILTGGIISATGNITGNYILGNGSQLTGLYGNANVVANLAALGSNPISTTGNITGGNAILTGTANTGVYALDVGATATFLSNTVASFTANVNNYTQLTLQNLSTGADATADFILTADNGSDTVNYGDFGIIDSGYDNSTPTNSLGNIVYAADTYLYAQGNVGNTNQSGGNLVIGTAVANKTVKIFAGGNTASALVANISNTGVSVTGNVTASNFIGNISITGNVTGTSANVTLVAGSYSTVVGNDGNVTAPSTGYLQGGTLKSTNSTGNEGGELQLALAPNATISGSTVSFDSYVNRVRIFEGGGNARGVYIDLAKAPDGVGGELMWKASGLVNAGVDVTLGNLKARIPTSGNRSLQVSTVSGTYSVSGSDIYFAAGVGGSFIDGSTPKTINTTPSYLNAGLNFNAAGYVDTWTIYDAGNSIGWRITLVVGVSYANNLITIERLV